MKPSIRYIAMAAIALVLGVIIFLVGQQKPDDSKLYMGVDGDPRMRLCDTPAQAALADPAILAALGIENALVQQPGDKARYRLAVLRPAGQESVAITFYTPDGGGGVVEIARVTNGQVSQTRGKLEVPAAATLVYALQDAGIWGDLKPTIESIRNVGEASAVVEVRAPKYNRCVTTRYDDERVRPLLAVFKRKIEDSVEGASLAAIVAPEQSFLPNKKP
jgi:hypothetical protein